MPDLSTHWVSITGQGVTHDVPQELPGAYGVQVSSKPGRYDGGVASARQRSGGARLATMTTPAGHRVRATAPTQALAELVASSVVDAD